MAKITSADVQAAVVSVNNSGSKGLLDTKRRNDSYYTLFGKQDFLEEGCPMANGNSEHIYAIKRYKGVKAHFYIKAAANGMFYNPMDMGTANRTEKQSHNIKSNSEYTEVREEVFNQYLKFLRTKNVSWLTQANRSTM